MGMGGETAQYPVAKLQLTMAFLRRLDSMAALRFCSRRFSLEMSPPFLLLYKEEVQREVPPPRHGRSCRNGSKKVVHWVAHV